VANIMSPTGLSSSLITDQLTRALGQAVIRIWSNLPQDVQDHLFKEAVASQVSPLDLSLPYSYMTGIRVRRTHWATLAKTRSQIASGAEDICKSGGLGAAKGINPIGCEMTKPKTRHPNPIDVYVGSRVRMRRFMLNLSQEKLGKALGITFQQVQKYEKGVNRMGSSRLQQAADILGVTVPFFFEGATDGSSRG
jgi:DNA-binding XRE family transcriptional regulator